MLASITADASGSLPLMAASPVAPHRPKEIPVASWAACTSSTSNAAPSRLPAKTSTIARALRARGRSPSMPASRQSVAHRREIASRPS
jgi:hypothetical protein